MWCGTARLRGKFANANAMAFLRQIRENSTSRSHGVNKNAIPLLGQSRNS